MPPRQISRQELPQLKPRIYCVYFICAVSASAGSRAHRVWISAYIGQFYRRAIFVLFCIFPCPLSPARPQGRSFVKAPQIPVQKCGILQDFVLYWIKSQHSRAAPGTKGATHEKHHRGKTRSHPQQRQPDAAGGIGVLLQVLWIFWLALKLNDYSTAIQVCTSVLDILITLRIYGLHINSAYKISWIILICCSHLRSDHLSAVWPQRGRQRHAPPFW